MADEQNNSSPKQWSLKHLAYHEAAHAVIAWNFGFEVLRVVVNRAQRSGYMLHYGTSKGGPEPIGDILALLAGGLAHRCYPSPVDRQQIHCSEEDYRLAFRQLARFADLPLGAEWFVMAYLMRRTRDLLDTPEVTAQIQTIASAVLSTGMLTKWQLQKRLIALPESTGAKKQCQAMKQRIEEEFYTVVEKAIADAPRIAALPGYEEMPALMKKRKQPSE